MRIAPLPDAPLRIAVIGSGIAGHGAALGLLAGGHDVTVFEKADRAGGHAATVDINYEGTPIRVDTGFIVFNEPNYPNLSALLAWLNVPARDSDMSFALSADNGRLEWCGRDERTMSGLFAQWSNAFSPRFYRMLRGILTFQNKARADLKAGTIGHESLAAYLAGAGVPAVVVNDYVVPMGAAIWSMAPAEVLDFPALSFFQFFDNHFLLQWDRPKWRSVEGGSRSYVSAIGEKLGSRLKLGRAIVKVSRSEDGVCVQDAGGRREMFDHVVLAVHGPQALALLADATPEEQSVLGAFQTSTNDVYLHRDPALMPQRKAAWAAWNVIRTADSDLRPAAVTYWMNALQDIPADKPLFISLNPLQRPDPALVFDIFKYAHPKFDLAVIQSQERLPDIQGRRRTWFCGAWTGHGFHEDGLRSGLNVAKALGGTEPWVNAHSRRKGDRP